MFSRSEPWYCQKDITCSMNSQRYLMTTWFQTSSHHKGSWLIRLFQCPLQVQLPAPLDRLVPGVYLKRLIAGLVATHHSHADLLKSLGVDACALYKAKQKEVSVIDVLPKQLQCKFYNQKFAQVGNLNVHIRRFHQEGGTLRDKKNFECGVCKKVFGESYTLKTHMKLHEEGGQKFRCDQCEQSFISVGKLNKHKKCPSGEVPCHWCGREMMDPRGLKEHQKRCRQCPGAPKDIPHPFQCKVCGKKYSQNQGSP